MNKKTKANTLKAKAGMLLLAFSIYALAFVPPAEAANNARIIRLKGFKGLWLSPPDLPLDGGDVMVHWKMNEAILNDRLDSADSKNLTEAGGVLSGAGKIGDAAGPFVGAHLNGNFFIDPGDTDFSFSGWVKFTSHANGQIPMQRCHDLECSYELRSDGTYMKWGVSSDGTTLNTSVISAVAIVDEEWMFVAVYHDSVNNRIGISVNNEQIVTASHTGGAFTITQNLRFGIGDGAVYFNGMVDSWTYWKRTLNPRDIERLWNNGNGLDYPFP